MAEERCKYVIKRFPAEGYTVMEISGYIGVGETEGLRKSLSREISNERPWMLMFLPGVTFISSSGMSALLMAVADARSYGGDVVFISMPVKVRKVLEFLDVMDFIRTADDEAEALALVRAVGRSEEGERAAVASEENLLYAGIAAYEKGDYERALELFGRLLSERPDDVQALKWKVSTLEKLGRFSEARKLETEIKRKGS